MPQSFGRLARSRRRRMAARACAALLARSSDCDERATRARWRTDPDAAYHRAAPSWLPATPRSFDVSHSLLLLTWPARCWCHRPPGHRRGARDWRREGDPRSSRRDRLARSCGGEAPVRSLGGGRGGLLWALAAALGTDGPARRCAGSAPRRCAGWRSGRCGRALVLAVDAKDGGRWCRHRPSRRANPAVGRTRRQTACELAASMVETRRRRGVRASVARRLPRGRAKTRHRRRGDRRARRASSVAAPRRPGSLVADLFEQTREGHGVRGAELARASRPTDWTVRATRRSTWRADHASC